MSEEKKNTVKTRTTKSTNSVKIKTDISSSQTKTDLPKTIINQKDINIKNTIVEQENKPVFTDKTISTTKKTPSKKPKALNNNADLNVKNNKTTDANTKAVTPKTDIKPDIKTNIKPDIKTDKKPDENINASKVKAEDKPKNFNIKVEDKPKTLAEEVEQKLVKHNKEISELADSELPGNKKKRWFSKNKLNPLPLTKVKRYSPELKIGLTQEQVTRRINEHLINATDQKYSKSYKSIFFGNIFTFFNLLCFIVAAALIYVKTEITDLFFVLIFTANIAIGIIQEIKAKLSIEKLSLVTSPTAKVLREGVETEIGTKEIVLDDIIYLSTGKQIPTDCVLAEGIVEVNESLLTGESIPIKKEVGDILYAGSFISSGNCKVRAEKVGKYNYIQTLTSKAKKYKKPNSELLNSLKLIMTIIGVLIVPITILMGFVNYNDTHNMTETIKSTATVAIGMIPSGMFLLTSMALAVGVIRLSKHNTLVQDLYSLEMLARVDVLCLDKTGTITDGRMKVSDCMLLNNNTNYTINEIIGSMLASLNDNNQTSIALYNHFGHSSMLKALKILPFSSKRKLSAVTFADVGTFVIGAPEFVMSTLPDKIDRLINQYAAMGLRVLMIAHSPTALNNDKIPVSLKPMALITIADNIREDAVTTIKWFKENDVAIKVISGDNPVTVSEVARRVGVVNAEKYISLEGLNEKEIINIANKYTVFGRVTPEQKAILIKAIKAAGHTVAMTGDGVNDILALKEADCSISVASGSEAARNVSHLVLTDNNFSSMPKIVNEGRRVINNIQKSSSLYLMKTIFTTVFAIISIILTQQYPFSPKNMLLLEICVIGIPSFFLSLQPNTTRVKGKFISFVLSRSIPSAFVMIVNVLIFKALPYVLPEFNYDLNYTTMATYAVTFSGLVMLYRISQPMNAFRGFLFSSMFLICLLFIVYLGHDMLLLENLSWQYILMIVCLIQLDFPISKFLMDIFDKMFGREQQLPKELPPFKK